MKHLSYTANSTKELVEDIKEVRINCLGGEAEEDSGYTVKGEIVSVISVSEYLSCRFCWCTAVPEDSSIAECT